MEFEVVVEVDDCGGNSLSQEFFITADYLLLPSLAIRHVEPAHFLKFMNVPRNIPNCETAIVKICTFDKPETFRSSLKASSTK